MIYAEKLKSPLWQKKRLEIFKRDKWKCKYCGDTEKTLHVHHLKYTGEPHEAPSEDLITLCKDCHFTISNLNFSKEIIVVKVQYINNEDSILVLLYTTTTNSKDVAIFFAQIKNEKLTYFFGTWNHSLLGYYKTSKKVQKTIR